MPGIRLNWTDNNFGEDSHKIYKDTSPLILGSLPAPLVTLGADVETYLDEAVVDGITYYYRVGATLGGGEEISDETSLAYAETIYIFEDSFEAGLGKWVFTDPALFLLDGTSPLDANAMLVKNGLDAAPGEAATAAFVSPPADFKPIEWEFDVYLSDVGSDDIGIISLQNAGSTSSLLVILKRETQTSSQRRVYLGTLQTTITLLEDVRYHFAVTANWTTGLMNLTVTGFPPVTGVSFNTSLFPVTKMVIDTQNDPAPVGKFHLDNITIL